MRCMPSLQVVIADGPRRLGPFDDLSSVVQSLGDPTPDAEALAATAYRILTADYLPTGPGERPRVYGISPLAPRDGYTLTDHQVIARRFARFLWTTGGFPVLPHLYLPQFLDDQHPTERTEALALGLAWLARCDRVAVLDLPPSSGMAGEIREAERLQMPIQRVPWEGLDLPPYAEVDRVRSRLFDAYAPI